jgi:molybdopterin synthase catalytic subunit
MVILSNESIKYDDILTKMDVSEAGSVVVHYALVKGSVEGKKTGGIRFSAPGDLEGELKGIEAKLRKKWRINDFYLLRRLGDLKIGDIIMVVAVSATGREDAFQACMEAVEMCKKLKNQRKEELFS